MYYGWQLVTGKFWLPYVVCKTAGKYIHVLHIKLPKCQQSPLSIKTLRNTKWKCLASSLVNAGLSQKLSVETDLSLTVESCVWGNTTQPCRSLSTALSSHGVMHQGQLTTKQWHSRWHCHWLLAFITFLLLKE